MPRVCLRTLPLTWCHGNEAFARYQCDKVCLLLTVEFLRYLVVVSGMQLTIA